MDVESQIRSQGQADSRWRIAPAVRIAARHQSDRPFHLERTVDTAIGEHPAGVRGNDGGGRLETLRNTFHFRGFEAHFVSDPRPQADSAGKHLGIAGRLLPIDEHYPLHGTFEQSEQDTRQTVSAAQVRYTRSARMLAHASEELERFQNLLYRQDMLFTQLSDQPILEAARGEMTLGDMRTDRGARGCQTTYLHLVELAKTPVFGLVSRDGFHSNQFSPAGFQRETSGSTPDFIL